MILSRTKLYSFLLIACMAGYSWLYFFISAVTHKSTLFNACLIKHIANIPCPSCGCTRSVMAIFKGRFFEAMQINPLGYVVAFLMLIMPVLIAADLFTKSERLLFFYKKTEAILRKPRFAIPLTILVLLNWYWNIKKGL